jgi:hypothetical protein
MTKQEIISRIIKLELEINRAIFNGHKSSDVDQFQEKRVELKILRDILFKDKNN